LQNVINSLNPLKYCVYWNDKDFAVSRSTRKKSEELRKIEVVHSLKADPLFIKLKPVA
jgi:hypothetical protein